MNGAFFFAVELSKITICYIRYCTQKEDISLLYIFGTKVSSNKTLFA